jgi:micrococcal nuclease
VLRLLRLILLLLFCGALSVPSVQAESARVKYVIDGDTVVLEDGRHVRLLAINTPEVEGRRPAEPGGEAAKRWLKARIEGKVVSLVADQQGADKYGRSLFYLFDWQRRFINEELLAQGFATLSIHPPNVKYLSRLQQAQQQAESSRLGIWRLPVYQPLTLSELVHRRATGWQRLRVVVTGIKIDRQFVRLIVAASTDIRIPKQHLAYFPDLNSYLHRELEVRGWASWRKGTLSILVRHPSALRVEALTEKRVVFPDQ